MRAFVFLLAAGLAAAADQFTKQWIRSKLEIGESIAVTGLFRLTHVPNTGSAFGLFQDYALPLAIVAFIGIAVILALVLFLHRRFAWLDSWLARLALGLVLGGTIGNLTDRLRLGYVTDFIDIGIWPAFNVADSAIVIGVIMFVYSLRSSASAGRTSA